MHSKQRGQANTGLIVTLVVVAIFLIIAAIGLNHASKGPNQKHRRGHRTVVKGEFLTPTTDGRGRYAYQNDGGDWYIYYWMMTDNSRYSTSTPPPLTGYPLPDGGTWARADKPPVEEEVLTVENEPVAETNAGVPETEEEFTTENQTDIENQSVEPENTTEPSAEPSAPSDSSPSDSGGDSGGDGGGDGGGGDGALTPLYIVLNQVC